MGHTRSSYSDFTAYTTPDRGKSYDRVFTTPTGRSGKMDPAVNPKNVTREARDSAAWPTTVPIIIGSDITGSMQDLAAQMIHTYIPEILGAIYTRKPVTDPQICQCAIGDSFCDKGPFQVTQFEADISLIDQAKKFWIEHGGGGNFGESYLLPWYFAAYHVKADHIEKRGKKGFLFTIGDEPPLQDLPKSHIEEIFGDIVQNDFTAKGLLDLITPHWEVFHMRVKNTHSETEWKELLGERCINAEPSKLAEIMVSTMQIIAGADVSVVIDSWKDAGTALAVRTAVSGLTKGVAENTGVVRL
jgi:hypothetical protein